MLAPSLRVASTRSSSNTGASITSARSSFVEPGDRAEVGDEVVFHRPASECDRHDALREQGRRLLIREALRGEFRCDGIGDKAYVVQSAHTEAAVVGRIGGSSAVGLACLRIDRPLSCWLIAIWIEPEPFHRSSRLTRNRLRTSRGNSPAALIHVHAAPKSKRQISTMNHSLRATYSPRQPDHCS
jgi:hypothetical protein